MINSVKLFILPIHVLTQDTLYSPYAVWVTDPVIKFCLASGVMDTVHQVLETQADSNNWFRKI